MTPFMRWLALLVILISTSSQAQVQKELQEELDDANPLATLHFDIPTTTPEALPQNRGLGPIASIKNSSNGYGLTFEFPLSEKLMLWSQAEFGTPGFIFNDGLKDYIFSSQKDRAAWTVGLDRYLFINQRHTVALFGGFAIGLVRSQVEATSYPKICGIWCGFDDKHPFTDSKIDVAFIDFVRLGLKIRDIKVFGSKFDWAIAMVLAPNRFPKTVDLKTIESGTKQIDPDSTGYFQAETTYRF